MSILSVSTAASSADALTLEMLDATRQRPLFAPTRRPPPEQKSRQTTEALRQQPQPDVALSAIIIGPGVQMAFLKRGKDTKSFAVQTGADVDGWSVTTIAPSHIVLDNKGRSITLEFSKRGNLPVPIPVGPTRQAAR